VRREAQTAGAHGSQSRSPAMYQGDGAEATGFGRGLVGEWGRNILRAWVWLRIGEPVSLHPVWRLFGTMPVNLSIKNAPDDVVQRLRERAERHHRSLQGELMAIIEAAAREDRPATPHDILAEVRRLGVQTASEAAAIVRADRDAHYGR
jgi:plasmid stability protein